MVCHTRSFATFGQMLELAGSLPDIVLRAEVVTSSSFCDAKAVP